jgi:hypothetical protein
MRPAALFGTADGDARLAGLLSLLTGAQAWAKTSADSLVRHVRLAGSGQPLSPADAGRRLESLIYELLDAHQQTARLAQDMEWDPDWREHLAQLRRLQRMSREVLSAASALPEPIVDPAR